MYSLNLKKATDCINTKKPKFVLIHVPDGLKPMADEIINKLRSSAGVDLKFAVWAGTCFGSCDIPANVAFLGIDMILHFGHTEYL